MFMKLKENWEINEIIKENSRTGINSEIQNSMDICNS